MAGKGSEKMKIYLTFRCPYCNGINMKEIEPGNKGHFVYKCTNRGCNKDFVVTWRADYLMSTGKIDYKHDSRYTDNVPRNKEETE
jgi:transposase-like protein